MCLFALLLLLLLLLYCYYYYYSSSSSYYYYYYYYYCYYYHHFRYVCSAGLSSAGGLTAQPSGRGALLSLLLPPPFNGLQGR